MKQVALVTILALLESSFVSPQNVPGGRLFPLDRTGIEEVVKQVLLWQKKMPSTTSFCAAVTCEYIPIRYWVRKPRSFIRLPSNENADVSRDP